MQVREIYNYLRDALVNYPSLVHASNFITKDSSNLSEKERKVLDEMVRVYYKYLYVNLTTSGNGPKQVAHRVEEVNNYYNFIHTHGYDNFFSAQGKFRPTILEEFCYLLFKDLVADINIQYSPEKIESGSAKAYTNLYFSASNLKEFVTAPDIGVNEKDQDFAIFKTLDLMIAGKPQTIKLPVIAVECKTYIDKTMLEGSIATAEKIKSGNPYSMFFIVTENYDVSLDVDPAYSRIDQIYVLRKCTRKSMKTNWKDIDFSVVLDFVNQVKNHLTRNWSDVEFKMTNEGKII